MVKLVNKPAQLWRRVPRRTWRWIVRICLLLSVVPLVLQWVVGYLVGRDARILPPQLLGAKNLLVVTAHPDDECLFFAPSILGLLDRNRDMTGGLLAMSIGNNYGIGETRKKELIASCKALGISEHRCLALDHQELQDNPTVWWDTELIEALVDDAVQKWEIDAIITFDSGGVSGHINHRAVSAAVSHYAASNPGAPVTFTLTTTSLLRKYAFLGDLALTALPFMWRIIGALSFPAATADARDGARALIANTWRRYLMTRQAFGQHTSQYTWDRHLYMVMSRYVWFNDLERVEPAAGKTEN